MAVKRVLEYSIKIRLLNYLEYKMRRRVLFYTQIVAFFKTSIKVTDSKFLLILGGK